VKKIAIANPQHAPYGQAAVARCSGKIFTTKIKDKFVLGENISQTASFVVSGAGDVGIVALSLAVSPEHERERPATSKSLRKNIRRLNRRA